MRRLTLAILAILISSSAHADLWSDIRGPAIQQIQLDPQQIILLPESKNTASQAADVNRSIQIDSSDSVPELASIRKYSPKIIGGEPVAYRQYPWQVALLHTTPPFRQFCGGTLIRNNWILTAAHCVDGGTNPSDVSVLIGTDFLDQGGEKHDVKKIIVHPSYRDATLGFDIALVELVVRSNETTIDFVNPLNESQLAFPGVLGWVTGWGITETGYPSIQLKDVDVRRLDNDTCNSPQMYDGIITETMLCAGYRIGEKDSCQGDSGGPLIAANQKGGMVLFGIVSWGEGCAVENRPGVYTRVAAFDSWIDSNLIN